MPRRIQKPLPVAHAVRKARESGEAAEERARERDRRFLDDRHRGRFPTGKRTETRNEVDGGRRKPETAHQDEVTAFVNGDEHHENEGELPTVEKRIEPDRGEKRGSRQCELAGR